MPRRLDIFENVLYPLLSEIWTILVSSVRLQKAEIILMVKRDTFAFQQMPFQTMAFEARSRCVTRRPLLLSGPPALVPLGTSESCSLRCLHHGLVVHLQEMVNSS